MPSPAEPRRLLVFRETLGQGGADRVTITLLRELDRRHFAPRLVLMRREGSLLPELPVDVPLHELGAGSLWSAWRPLADLLRQLSPDIVFSTSGGGSVAAALAARLAGFRGRLVLSERNGLIRDQPYPKRWLLLLMKRLLYRRADAVVTVSEGVRHDVIRRLGLGPHRVVTTYNPVIAPGIEEAAAEPLEHACLAGRGSLILAAGRLEPAKDFATLVRAFARLRERHAASLVILGEGRQRAVLEALATELGCSEAVHLPGFDRNPFRWMSRCTLFVLSSRFEGLPGVLIQAMACGAPVVATDCPFGAAEVIEHGTNGLLVPVGDVAGLTRAMAGLLEDAATRRQLSESGRQSTQRFRLEEVLPRYESVLLAAPGAPAGELRVAIVGAGHIAAAHLRAWRRVPGFRVAGIFDVAPEVARRRAAEFRLSTAFRDLDETLAAADVLDVCTPPDSHAEIIERAAAAGRHLLVEKPIVTRLGDWERLLPYLEASPGRLAVVHNLKFSRAVLQARRWLAAGAIGNLLRIEHQFLTHPEADRMLAHAHWSHELPGGRWFETLPHALYLTHTFAGPLALRSVVALTTPRAPVGASADEVTVTLAGGCCIGTIHYSANCVANRRSVVLEGSDGRISIDVLADAAFLTRSRDSRWRRALGPALLGPVIGIARALPDRAGFFLDRLRGGNPHARLIAAFADHLRGNEVSPTPLPEIDYAVRTCEQIGREIDRRLGEARATS